MLEKKKNEMQAQTKPKFLTKEDREQEALNRRRQEVEAQRKQMEEERQKRQKFMEAAERSLGVVCFLE